VNAIYKPKGRAAEYAPLACNLYRGCSHGCTYCYAPAALRRPQEEWAADHPPARPGILDALRLDAERMRQASDQREVLFCFSCDPYHGGDTGTTREALRIMGEAGLRATVLTKGGTRAARDFDLFKRYGFSFGQSIVWNSNAAGTAWEPGASLIHDRRYAAAKAHDVGILTWVSLEPVIYPAHALAVVRKMYSYVDIWKVGKINHDRALEAAVDWAAFLRDIGTLMDDVGANGYIKTDLAQHWGETSHA